MVARGLVYEEFEPGAVYHTARMTVTESSIIDFALLWDPQPFHIDRFAAQESIFGELIGSGLQTLMLSYRLYFDHGLVKDTALAGLGIDDLRFVRPLRPNDTICVRITVLDKRPSKTAGRGIVSLLLETNNHKGETILSLVLKPLVVDEAVGPTNSERR
ncbi:MaoC/PaaZ C-terminal domain-containing protein [Sinorhizobium sp. GL28]|uniref:MaoC/PaaZ C-terminal domain-containing protein n=1 Tax=Sinorhizobium sp. GL28 TaxID=1358418 RepID=UPI00071D794F|nr:MaoC/PaaZ C-terminal domain-containing protein [Sinorhizobium sp. GL28]KSV87267.1 hypothetical protein N184_31460 [Sinorhizobium sp. GL28]